MLDDSPSTRVPHGPMSRSARPHTSLIDRCRKLPIGSVARVDRRLTVDRVADLELPEELFGWRAPSSWHGVAVILGGTTTLSDADGFGADAGAVCLGAVALRDGTCVAWADVADRTLAESDDPIGLVPDTCRRSVGLPSHPDHPRIGDLANLRWLSAILHLAADPTTASKVSEWDDLSALHPAADHRPLDDAEDLALSLADLEELTDWQQVHELGSRIGWEDLSAAEVAWMDPAMFARWTVGSHRPVSELITDLSLFLPSHLLGAVCAVLLDSKPARA